MVYDSNSYLTTAQMKVNAQYIATWFIKKGWTPNAISAMLGNMQSESGINFGIYESLNSSSTTNGFGLVQWTPNTKYFNWAASNGYANDHVNGELNRILWEVANKQQWYATSTYPISFQQFTQSTDTPYNLAMAFLKNYERPANPNQPARGTQAQTWYDTLDWSNPDATPAPTGMNIGDTVTIASYATTYATGETMSSWVPGTKHKIIQIRDQVTSYSHKAYLLDGIMSWVLEQDIVESGVTIPTTSDPTPSYPAPEPAPVPDPIPVSDTTPPLNVTNLAVTTKTFSSVYISWTASSSTDVDSYNIYRNGTFVGNTESTSFRDDALDSATTYTYEVETKDTSNNLSDRPYPMITVTTEIRPDPTPPDPIPVPEPSLNNVLDIKKQDIQLYLAKPNLQTVHKFSDVNNRKLTVKYNDLYELSFSIPYKVDINHQLVDNPAVALVRERYVVKVVLGQLEEYFVINKLTKSDNVTTSEVMDLTIHCFYLPYELYYKRYRSYTATSYNCLQVTTDCLDSTPWKVGNIDPVFDTKYRQFDLSSGTRLDFLNQIGTSFNAIKTFDTKNRLVNFVQEENISKFKGWNIKPSQYLDGISDDIDLDQMVTRLYCYGNNDLTFNNVSPNGQSYIEDFSHFLYPFEINSFGNIVQHSNYMSDALCKAILDHGELVEQNKGTLSNYLNQISQLQQDITTINNKINDDNNQLTILDNDIKIATQYRQDTTLLNQQRTDIVNDIAAQNSSLTNKKNQIDSITATMNDLKNVLILENYLENNSLGYLVDELRYYIIEDEFTDDNIIDPTDLYNEGISELGKRNSPPVNISISLIDFLACVEESYNWNRLSIGDLVNIIHPTLGIKVQAKITQIDYDFEGESIQVGISNGTIILSDFEKVIMNSYNSNRTTTDYNNRKIDWQKTSYNFNSRNDRISETPVDPTFNNNEIDISHTKNDDGSVTITVNWNYPSDMTVNENNIDGFNVYLYASNKWETETVTLGSMGNNESIINMNADARKCTIPSVPANLYYYIGVQAYRDVDNDISSSGILLSNIAKSSYPYCYPYQPEETVDVTGKLNGINYSVGSDPPPNPNINDQWTDTTTNIRKIYTSDGWKDINSGTANSVGGYVPSTSVTAGSIPIRNAQGSLDGDITGSAQYLNGKSDTDFAQLDSSGKVSTNVLPIGYSFGSYTGDGTGFRKITLPFTPRLVRVYSTNTSDTSVYINSVNGGYKLNTSTSSIILVGLSDGTPYSQFGKLTDNGFVVAQDNNLYSNKNNVLYWYEAFL